MDIKQLFKIRSNTLHPLQGNLLLAEPMMDDFHFGRSVILLIDHNESEGSLGIIMNKSLNARMSEIGNVFQDFDAPVFWGGPVAENQIFFMHTLGDLIPDSYPIMEGLYWGGDTETLNKLISTGIANKENIRFFLGYSGWEAGQLTDELKRNSWAVCKTDLHTLLTTPFESMWKTYVTRLGKPYQMWLQFPQNPEYN